jgi:hypothetical protein
MVKYVGHTSDGLLYLSVNGLEYIYRLDAAVIPGIIKDVVYQPFKTLLRIKKTCDWYIDKKGELHETK